MYKCIYSFLLGCMSREMIERRTAHLQCFVMMGILYDITLHLYNDYYTIISYIMKILSQRKWARSGAYHLHSWI